MLDELETAIDKVALSCANRSPSIAPRTLGNGSSSLKLRDGEFSDRSGQWQAEGYVSTAPALW